MVSRFLIHIFKMANYDQIPDIDQQLAKEIGNILNQNRSVLSSDDYLIDRIGVYKKHLYLSHQDEIAESKNAVWNKVSTTVQQQKKHPDTYLKKNSGSSSALKYQTFYKIAAAFLIAALLSIFYFQNNTYQSELLVQSSSEISTHTLNDGSRIQLRPHSAIYLVRRTGNQVRYRLEGEAYFNVIGDAERKFIVEAGSGVVEVLGTSFNIREWGDETVVYLEEGSLSFSSGATEVLLQPGEMAAAKSNQITTPPKKVNSENYLSWQKGQIVFENRTAESIIKELEHHYSIEILIPQHIKTEILGGTLSLENRKISLNNLGVVLGGNFSSIGDDTYQFVE